MLHAAHPAPAGGALAHLPGTDVLVSWAATARSLRAAQAVAEVDVPLLGIDLGDGGLPLEGRGARAGERPRQLRRGYVRHPRAHGLADASGRPSGRDASRRPSNDIVVARGSLARVVKLDVTIDESHLATFVADGLVVSATGSTGYSFSAGGPILDPQSRNLVVTPIAGLLSAIRSIVVSPQQVVRTPGPRRPGVPGLHRRPRGPPDRG